jgi:hypothetical protein
MYSYLASGRKKSPLERAFFDCYIKFYGILFHLILQLRMHLFLYFCGCALLTLGLRRYDGKVANWQCGVHDFQPHTQTI